MNMLINNPNAMNKSRFKLLKRCNSRNNRSMNTKAFSLFEHKMYFPTIIYLKNSNIIDQQVKNSKSSQRKFVLCLLGEQSV